jgi:hypothetical protein
MKYFQRLLRDITKLENIELIPIVLLGLITFVLELLDVKIFLGRPIDELLPSLNLVALGLLAVGFLFTRYRIEEIYMTADPANRFVFSRDNIGELEAKLKTANEILLVGINLRKTTIDHFESFKDIGKRGGTVRALIANPNKIDMQNLVTRFGRGRTTVSQYLTAFEQTIYQFDNIRNFNIDRKVSNPEAVQLKAIDFIPTFSLYVFPDKKDGAVAYVEIYGYKSPAGAIPKFIVTKSDNPQWFDHFVMQFESMWVDSEPIKLPLNQKPNP